MCTELPSWGTSGQNQSGFTQILSTCCVLSLAPGVGDTEEQVFSVPAWAGVDPSFMLAHSPSLGSPRATGWERGREPALLLTLPSPPHSCPEEPLGVGPAAGLAGAEGACWTQPSHPRLDEPL